MGNVTLPVGATDKRVTEYLRAYFDKQTEIGGGEAITQAKLARGIGKNEAYISRRMSGLLPWLSVDVDAIAGFLDVKVTDIYKGPKK